MPHLPINHRMILWFFPFPQRVRKRWRWLFQVVVERFDLKTRDREVICFYDEWEPDLKSTITPDWIE